MAAIVKSRTLIGALAVTWLVLSGCSKLDHRSDQMAWARAALERNDRVQVIASDPEAKTFTVRVKDSGQLLVVAADQLVAGPVQAAGPAPASDSSAPISPAAASSTPTAADTAVSGAAAPPSSTPAQSSTAASAATSSTTSPSPESEGSAAARNSSATGGEARNPAAAEIASEAVAPIPGPHSEAAVDAKAGSVLASGPGYTISASGGAPIRLASAAPPRGAAIEHHHDPIICQGDRLLHIDNRNIEFDGDALTAEGGCDMHITNSHIRAKGIGVLARAANVHIENSEIDGDSGAIDASDGAQVYAEASRFKGVTRHMDTSAYHDLGGNVWN